MTLSSVKPNVLGIRVVRTAQDLFDGTTTSIFIVSGGVVSINYLAIEVVDAALDATTDNVRLTGNPTTGTSRDMCANLDVASDEQGTIYTMTGTIANALVGTDAGAIAAMVNPILVSIGTIDLTSSGDSNNGNTALQKVTLFYEPIDEGALVVAA